MPDIVQRDGVTLLCLPLVLCSSFNKDRIAGFAVLSILFWRWCGVQASRAMMHLHHAL
ncbi:hypothetical protein [Paraburkholderia pallida]|uniref:hypothetical protein n=1 Tax=Paraburkholderia pallida TaxID=2547399 RepID=UPI00142F7235|nr:hypothetical protein [Paraburkholderia pallida]